MPRKKMLGTNPSTYTPKNLPQTEEGGGGPGSGRKKGSKNKKTQKAKTWIGHVKKTWNAMKKKNKSASYKDAMKAASKTWKK